MNQSPWDRDNYFRNAKQTRVAEQANEHENKSDKRRGTWINKSLVS